MSTEAIEAYTSSDVISNVPYEDWTSWWWLWALQGPRAFNPVFDGDGRNADRNQPTNYNVKFLAGTFDRERPANRSIQFHSDDNTSLLIPVVNSNISREEHDDVFKGPTSSATLLAAADDVIKGGNGSLRIDNGGSSVEYKIGGSGARIPERITPGMTPMFPGQGIVQGHVSKLDLDFMYAALDGYWVFLKPLAAGDYTFTIHGEAPWFGGAKGQPPFTTDVTYKVTIS